MSKATQVVHWPGKDVLACENHAGKLRLLGDTMGVSVSCTPIQIESECGNCVNEEVAELNRLTGEEHP
jgi:hypothetical protein